MIYGKPGYGRMDGSQRGLLSGGRGRNKTSICRHPSIKKKRKKNIFQI
jgi:hypothetical protein